MRKIYSLMLAALVAFAATAAEYTIKVVPDTPGTIEVQWLWEMQEPNDDGEFILVGDTDSEYDDYLCIYPVQEYFLPRVTCGLPAEEPDDVSYMIRDFSAFECPIEAEYDGMVFYVTAIPMSEAYDMSITVNVDVPEALEISTYFNNDFHFTEHTTTLELSSMLDLPITISKNYDYPGKIYQVKHNGEPVEDSYGYYYVMPADGDVVDVTFTFPDIDVPVTLNVTPEEYAADFWMTVNNERVEVTEGLTLKAGTDLELYYANFSYDTPKVTINGEPLDYFWNGYTISVSDQERIDIEVEMTPLPKYYATVIVDDPEAVGVWQGTNAEGEPYPLVAGENRLEYSEQQYGSYFTIMSMSGYSLKEVKTLVDGEPDSYTGANAFTIALSPDIIIEVTTERVIRDKTMVVYLEGTDMVDREWSYVQRADRRKAHYEDGYNVYEYGDAELPFGIAMYPITYDMPITTTAFLNDEPMDPNYEDGTNYSIPHSDYVYDDEIGDWIEGYDRNFLGDTGVDVVKLYVNNPIPTFAGVVVEFEGFEDVKPEVYRDLLVKVEDPEFGFFALQGTLVDIKGDESAKIDHVEFCGLEILPDEDGNCRFLAEAPAAEPAEGEVAAEDPADGIDPGMSVDPMPVLMAKVVAKDESGVENVAVEAPAVREGIYNLQGMRIRADRRSLPTGIYVIDGQKTVVK